MPGTEVPTSRHQPALGCSFRTQQGAVFVRHPQPHQRPFHRASPGTRCAGRCRFRLASVSAFEHPSPTLADCGLLDRFPDQLLLRKEVIQPHLPVRLPCYDFVPIASPTFDGSLPYGLGHRLRVLPTFVT